MVGTMTMKITVELPEPGELTEDHAPTETVWYFCQHGEFSHDSYNDSLHDGHGNVWGADELREMAAAALAAAEYQDNWRGQRPADP